jgi:antitoxin component of MazEF toxin-antitoxin module
MTRTRSIGRHAISRFSSVSLGSFPLRADAGDGLLVVFPRPIARALGMVPGQRLRIDLQDGEIRVRLPDCVRRQSLFRASAGWPAIRQALRSSRVVRG